MNPFAPNCGEQASSATQEAQARGAEGDVYGKCCLDPAREPFYQPVQQERAWTSPIWVMSTNLDREPDEGALPQTSK